MTRRQAEIALRSMLLYLRRRAGQISQTEIRRYEVAIRTIARQLSAGTPGTLTRSRARALARAMEAILREIEQTLQQTAEKAITSISHEITNRYQTVHAQLFRAQGLPTGGVVQRFDVVPERTLRRLASLGGRTLSLPQVVSRNINLAQQSVETYIRAATGKVPDQVAVRSILRLLDGKLPVDLPDLGLEAKELTGAKGLVHRGRRIVATESFNTLRVGTSEAGALSPIIHVARWTLSPEHSVVDECDDLATADSGHGPGWYLPEDWPEAPHPHCKCHQSDVRAIPPDEWQAAS